MKRIVFFLVVFGLTVSVYAQSQLPPYQFAAGNWVFAGKRLFQNDANARLAKVNFQAPQSGPMLYEFNVIYEGGAEDGHGGFGLHIFGDQAYNARSWGNGNSYLLWLNYDENPIGSAIPKGLSAQVYRSYTNTWMELVESVALNEYEEYLTNENLSSPVPFKIIANGSTGEVRVYDPTDPDAYYLFNIPRKDIPLKGNWAALRTNGIKLSFAPGE
ncbi:hypothetical protein FACS189479_00390 [Spirochaetia bacterium]|nr:hypothetical protein FACS189479_00390 [Spirochaetia bacterium]